MTVHGRIAVESSGKRFRFEIISICNPSARGRAGMKVQSAEPLVLKGSVGHTFETQATSALKKMGVALPSKGGSVLGRSRRD